MHRYPVNVPMTLFVLNEKLDILLAAIPGDNPTGLSMRYDNVMNEIRTARYADDPSLPLGEWDRPLKKSDWSLVNTLCSTVLSKHSKDLQCAAWLTEAWIHLYQIDGLQAGVTLLSGLLEKYWNDIHPNIEEDNNDARVAPLFWLNETLPTTLHLHICLMHLPDQKPSKITLDDWENASFRDDSEENEDRAYSSSSGESQSLVSRADLIRQAGTMPLKPLMAAVDQIHSIAATWLHMEQFIDGKLGNEAPSLSRVSDLLARIERVLTTLIAGRTEVSIPPIECHEPAQVQRIELDKISLGMIDSRETAYRLLETVASYLIKMEPHSPTPYLIARAISWGRMPLPELMNEILREDGDLNHLFTLLRLNKKTE
jgi:type VI secretion system protein ImpA